MMDQTPYCSDSVIGIADYVIVHSMDDEEQDRCFHKLVEMAHEHGLAFNGEMYAVKQLSVTFFGCLYNKDRAHIDPAKVSAALNVPPQEIATQLSEDESSVGCFCVSL